jgi:hypothetical protein
MSQALNVKYSEEVEPTVTLRFANIVKGQITRTVLKTILERGGYRVTRLGIEELFGEIKHLDLQEYHGLSLPMALRYLPDLLVADAAMTRAFLVEVKFRRGFDEQSCQSLYNKLRKQREYWENSYAVIMLAEPMHPRGRFFQDYVRVAYPGVTDWLIDSNYSL